VLVAAVVQIVGNAGRPRCVLAKALGVALSRHLLALVAASDVAVVEAVVVAVVGLGEAFARDEKTVEAFAMTGEKQGEDHELMSLQHLEEFGVVAETVEALEDHEPKLVVGEEDWKRVVAVACQGPVEVVGRDIEPVVLETKEEDLRQREHRLQLEPSAAGRHHQQDARVPA